MSADTASAISQPEILSRARQQAASPPADPKLPPKDPDPVDPIKLPPPGPNPDPREPDPDVVPRIDPEPIDSVV